MNEQTVLQDPDITTYTRDEVVDQTVFTGFGYPSRPA